MSDAMCEFVSGTGAFNTERERERERCLSAVFGLDRRESALLLLFLWFQVLPSSFLLWPPSVYTCVFSALPVVV